MAEKIKNDAAKDQKEDASTALIKTTVIWRQRSNLAEIQRWETENTSWVGSLGPI